MNHVNAIALNLMSLGLGSRRGLSLGDVALIIAWTVILIVYVAGQAWRFPPPEETPIEEPAKLDPTGNILSIIEETAKRLLKFHLTKVIETNKPT